MWFAAEEGGLIGSSNVAALYKKEQKNVHRILQLDMTGAKFLWNFVEYQYLTYFLQIKSKFGKIHFLVEKNGK